MERKPRQFHRRKLMLWVLLLIALVGVYWWWQRARPLRYVAGYPLYVVDSGYLASFAQGFIFQEKRDTYTCCDWQGRVRWRVQPAPQSFTDGWPTGYSYAYLFRTGYVHRQQSLSPNGHWFATASIAGRKVRVQSWHDGRPADDLTLPLRFHAYMPKTLYTDYYALAVTDSGRLLIAFPRKLACELVAIEHGRITACGRYVSTLPPGSDHSYHPLFSPDSTAMVVNGSGGRFIVYSLTVRQGHITVQQRYPMQTTSAYKLFANGMVWEGSFLFHPNGRRDTREFQMLSPSGEYGFTGGILYWPGKTFRYQPGEIINLRSGTGWRLPIVTSYQRVFLSENGRYAVAGAETTPYSEDLPNRALNALCALPGIDKSAQRWAAQYRTRRDLRFYERPGHLRAYLHCLPSWQLRYQGKRYDIVNKGLVSPDGHAMLLFLCDPPHSYRIHLYRW